MIKFIKSKFTRWWDLICDIQTEPETITIFQVEPIMKDFLKESQRLMKQREHNDDPANFVMDLNYWMTNRLTSEADRITDMFRRELVVTRRPIPLI